MDIGLSLFMFMVMSLIETYMLYKSCIITQRDVLVLYYSLSTDISLIGYRPTKARLDYNPT